jgi:hypothetical protein
MNKKVFVVPPTLNELKKRQQRVEMEQAKREYKLSRKQKGYTVNSEMKD